MARIGFFILLTIILVTNSATAQQTPQWGDMGNGNFRNPVIPSDYSDPDIIRVGDDYYGIASTFQFSPGMIVIHSKDLVNWTIINHIVDDISFLNPDLNWDKMKGYYNGIWAGSIRYHDGMFYCHFTTPRGGWFVATTTHPAKKWNVQAMKDRNGKELRGPGWDDNCPLWDDDGQAYIIASNFGEFWWPHLYKMSADGTTLLDGTINPNSVNPEKNMEIIGGYVMLVVNEKNKIINSSKAAFPNTTNNYNELLGLINSISYIVNNCSNDNTFKIYSDSEYAVKSFNEYMHKWVNNSWKGYNNKPIKNLDLWKIAYQNYNNISLMNIPFEVIWIKGHAGKKITLKENSLLYFQELCDSKCTEFKNQIIKNISN